MPYTAIAAMNLNMTIGANGLIPWRLPSDLRYFKQQTLNKTCLMGMTTFLHLPTELQNRKVVVYTRVPHLASKANHLVKFTDQLNLFDDDPEEIMVCGGEELYKAFAPKINKVLLTVVVDFTEGDRRMPIMDILKPVEDWKTTTNTGLISDPQSPLRSIRLTLERCK